MTIEQVAKRIENFIIQEVMKGQFSQGLLGSSLSDVVGTAKESKVPVLATGGARNYTGTYADSDTSVSYVTLTNANSRQLCYKVPGQEKLEAGLEMLTKIAVEQAKEHQLAEVDAVRFANLADGADSGQVDTTELTEDNIEATLKGMQTTLFENGYAADKVKFYVNSATHDLLGGAIVWDTVNGTGDVKQIVKRYNESEIIKVPQDRFYTAIELLDTAAGGYEIATGGKNIRVIAVAVGNEIVPTKGVDHSLIIPASKNQNGYNDEFKSLFGFDLHVLGTKGAKRICVNHEA